MIKVRIGIDLGKKGAIAIYHDDILQEPVVMPVVNKTEYDIHFIANELLKYTDTDQYDVHIVTEDIHAIYGSSAGGTFDFGRGLGIFEGIICAYGLPYTKVMPKKWQKDAFEGVSEIRKPASVKQQAVGRRGDIDTKAMALVAIKRLFPNLKLTFGTRAHVPHDGLVDAVHLARYCKLNF